MLRVYTAAMHESDSGYHLLFSNPKLVEDLFRSFIPEQWVQQLDFSTLQRVNAKLHAENLERREGDIIYRVDYQEGGAVYLYLMLEFQSQSDHWMVVRVGAYLYLLYQHLIKEGQITQKTGLAPIFPLVLYNGDKPWKSATSLRELLPLPKTSPLWAWQPDMSYYLLEERRYPKEQGDSLVGLLFEMENCEHPRQLTSVIERLDECLSNPQEASLRRAFLVWIKHVLTKKKTFVAEVENINELSEVYDMLATRLDQWEEKILEKGIEKGIGKGEALVLQRLLRQRFGELPTWSLQRLEQANREEIASWIEKVLNANSLEAIFED